METIFVEKLRQNENGQWAWMPEALTFNTEQDLSIDERNLDKEFCQMGKLLLKYGDLAAELRVELERKEESLKHHAARLAGAERSQAETTGTKMTEGKLKEQVILDPGYQNELAQLHVVRAASIKADHWWRSMNTKAKMLGDLAFKQNAEVRRGY